MTKYCEKNPNKPIYTAAYLEYAITIPILLILQFGLLIHTLYNERNIRQKRKTSRKKGKYWLSLRILFLALQCIGILETVNTLMRLVIDPPLQTFQDTIICDIVAYYPKISLPIYYAIYLMQILLRLHLSFKDSSLELSKMSVIMLSLLIIVYAIATPLSVLIYVDDSCLWRWEPSDIVTDHTFAFCSTPNIDPINMCIIVGLIWIAVTNIIFGAIFTIKLRKAMKLGRVGISGDDPTKNLRLHALVVKNSILTLVGSVSTLTNWSMFVVTQKITGGNGIFVFLDLYINCVVVALMFRYNARYYKMCCKCCIMLSLMDCDKPCDRGNEPQDTKQHQYGDDYLHNIEPISPSFSAYSDNGGDGGDGIGNRIGSQVRLSHIVGDMDFEDCGTSPRDMTNQDKDKVDPSNHGIKGNRPQFLSLAHVGTNNRSE